MSEADVVGTIPPPTSNARKPKTRQTKAAGAPRSSGERPTRVLPTNRVGFTKQLNLLRGYAALGGPGKAASNAEVAKLVNLHRDTAGLANPFFTDIGLLTKSGGGYIPSAEVIAFHRAHSWNAETATHRLAPLLRRSWFAQVLLPRLTMGTMDAREAIELLAQEAAAGPKYAAQLEFLLQYLRVAGLLVRDGDVLRDGIATPEGEISMPSEAPVEMESASETGRETARAPSIATAFSHAPDGVLRFNVDVNVDLREFASWKPERISAFWAGIAQVLAAKADVERPQSG